MDRHAAAGDRPGGRRAVAVSPRGLVDRRMAVQHPSHVLSLRTRLPALLVTLVLSAGNMTTCAGWMATPEARMSCCSGGLACPMHADSHNPSSPRTVSQAEADSCCAASERDDAAPPESTFVLAVSLGLVTSTVEDVVPHTTIHPDSWRTLVPVPATHVPKHLLLSVLLV